MAASSLVSVLPRYKILFQDQEAFDGLKLDPELLHYLNAKLKLGVPFLTKLEYNSSTLST